MKRKPYPQLPSSKKPKGISILTFLALLFSGGLAYVIGEMVWISKPHLVHYILVPPIALAGYLFGEWLFKRRGYQDIM